MTPYEGWRLGKIRERVLAKMPLASDDGQFLLDIYDRAQADAYNAIGAKEDAQKTLAGERLINDAIVSRAEFDLQQERDRTFEQRQLADRRGRLIRRMMATFFNARQALRFQQLKLSA